MSLVVYTDRGQFISVSGYKQDQRPCALVHNFQNNFSSEVSEKL